MTPQEQEMIEGLIQRIQQTQLPAKDNEAEALLQQGLGRNPDAIYILAQTVLVQKYALDQAQTQLTDAKADLAQAKADLEAAKQAAKPHTSFLGSLLGTDHPAPHLHRLRPVIRRCMRDRRVGMRLRSPGTADRCMRSRVMGNRAMVGRAMGSLGTAAADLAAAVDFYKGRCRRLPESLRVRWRLKGSSR